MQVYSFIIFHYQMISFLRSPLRHTNKHKNVNQTCNEKLPSLSSCLLTALKYFYTVSKQLSFFYHKCQYLLNIYPANNLNIQNQLHICLPSVPVASQSDRTGISRHAHIYRCFFYSLLQVNPSKLGEYFYSHYQFLFTLHCPTILNLSPPTIPPYLFWVINLTDRRRFVHLLSARVGRENLHQGSRKSRSLHQLQFVGLSAVSLLFLLSRIFYRPDIILPDCLPFPLLSKKTGAKADRFLLFSKCDRKVWQPCCRLPARAVLRRTPPPRDVRGCRLGQTTWGTLNLG